ncbi:peripherin-2-like isoform X1 [Galleria mellonella]|uniref:Peripherin-2-like isoform X1 n=1 Tax=Galleria mellonella TaxID=7137 RepID=A0ABM3MPI2_GALME|nr:peripherin-2-like isoform X1 [Galleria mellonella]
MGCMFFVVNIIFFNNMVAADVFFHKAKVVCCPLWLSVFWIVIIAIAAIIICIDRIYSCQEATSKHLNISMKNYRSFLNYKKFMDNLQWSLKCCGINSYKDWFSYDWYDQMRDYEWDPSLYKRNKKEPLVTDSVPLSCCKSGSCISNYLLELGTNSINTKGCGKRLRRVIMLSMSAYLIIFILIIIVELLIVRFLIKQNNYCGNQRSGKKTEVRHIMSVNDKFHVSSASCQLDPEESDDEEASRNTEVENLKMDMFK